MLKKRQRLTQNTFDISFKRGKRYHSPLLQLIHDTTDQDFHGAVVVGKKVYKKAVDRNKLRRSLYGVVYNFQRSTKQKGTYIIIVKPTAKTASAREMRSAAQELLQQVVT